MKSIRITTAQTMSFLRKAGIFLSLAMLVASLIPTPTYAQAAQCDKDFYSSNNILFYDPCASTCSTGGSGSLTGPAPSALTGETNQEKVWNYFIARGLTPVAAAGAMGNIEQESGTNFDPWAGEHGSTGSLDKSRMGTGFGLIQWTNTGGNPQGRRYGVMKYLEDNGVALTASDPSQTDNALLYELNFLWDGEYKGMLWQEQVNAETTVEGDPSKDYSVDNTGNGSAMVFHKLVERSGDGATGKQERIDSAKAFLAQFSGTDASSVGCSSVGAGGLTYDQAVEVAKKLVDNWNTIYCGSSAVTTGGNPGGYCDWTEGYCTAGAAWMAAITAPDPSVVPGIPNGVDVANRLVSMNPEVYTSANADGSNVQPFSVWSFGYNSSTGQPGHTGTIVGVGTDGSIVTLETNWAGETTGATESFLYNPGHKVAVFQYPSFEAFKTSRGSGYTFNAAATPKDSSVAAEMGKKITAFMGN